MTFAGPATSRDARGAALHAFLRTRLEGEFDGNISQLARACHTSTSLAAKWLAEDPDRRKIPGPDSCQKIADAVGVDLDYVLALAGHRRVEVAEPAIDPRLGRVVARWPKLSDSVKEAIGILAAAGGLRVNDRISAAA